MRNAGPRKQTQLQEGRKGPELGPGVRHMASALCCISGIEPRALGLILSPSAPPSPQPSSAQLSTQLPTASLQLNRTSQPDTLCMCVQFHLCETYVCSFTYVLKWLVFLVSLLLGAFSSST